MCSWVSVPGFLAYRATANFALSYTHATPKIESAISRTVIATSFSHLRAWCVALLLPLPSLELLTVDRIASR